MAKRIRDQKLRHAKNAVRGALNRPKSPYFETINRWGRAKLSPTDLIVGNLSTLAIEDAEQFLSWVKGFPSKSVKAFPTKPIQKPADMEMSAVKIRMPLIVRINWLSALLVGLVDDISQFLELRSSFEARFIAGRYDEAQQALDRIREQFGYSIWYIEVQLALLQRWKGLDAQKEFSRSVGANARGKLASVTASWVSQRNEDNTVFTRFKTRLERSIENWNVDQSVRDAYQIILGSKTFAELPDDRASSALGSLASASLVDAYTSLIFAFETMFISPQWAEADELLRGIASRLPTADTRVRNIIAILDGNLSSVPLAPTITADSIATSRSMVKGITPSDDTSCFSDIAFADALEEDNIEVPWPVGTPARDFFEVVEAAIVRRNGFETKLDQGSKLIANLRHLNISEAIHGLLVLQNPSCPLISPSAAILFYINSETFHPWHTVVLPRQQSVSALSSTFPRSPFANQILQAIQGRLPLNELCVPLREVAARIQLTTESPDRAIGYLQFKPSNDLERQRLAPLRTMALLRMGRIQEAITACSSACAIDVDLASLMPLQDLVDEAKARREAITDHLSLAILLNMYRERYVEDDVFQLMQFAYEDYIAGKGVQRPSELIAVATVDETERLIYFLRDVAVPEVMDVSFWLFKSSRETQIERIAVLNALTELDPFSEDEYREEIKERTKLLSIQDGLEDVDRSRVYVNLPKLQRWAETELRESFDRYQALQNAGVSPEDPAEFDKVLKDFSSGKGTLDRFSEYPADESGQLLLDMYNSIAEKYLHDEDIGLDAYLSMRIRHGSLAGHIRGPLEEHGLLAVRDQGTNQYRVFRRPSMANRFSSSDWDKARRSVETFSREFDSILDRLAKEQLQIKGASKPKGLFAFDPSPLIIYYLRANIDKGSSFSQFLSKAFEVLGVYLTVSLQNVRRFVTGEFYDNIEKCVDGFRSSLDSEVTNWALRSELQELLGRASPELKASVERVASWFAPDAENERRALRTMEQIVDIAIEATNNAHRGFTPEWDLDIQDLGLQSNETFIEFTDILFTILDNIYRHSGLETRPKISISIGADDVIRPNESTPISISVSNSIDASIKTSANERKLERIRAQIHSGDYRALSKLEGGTGFLKLKRIVAVDPRQTLDFGYRSNAPEFFVDVTVHILFRSDDTSDSLAS